MVAVKFQFLYKIIYMPTYCITSQTYYDCLNTYYKNILVINNVPVGPLSHMVRRIQNPPVSAFMPSSPPCINALYKCNDELMTPDDIGNLFNFLLAHGYTIDTALTTMMNGSAVKGTNKLVCYISITC